MLASIDSVRGQGIMGKEADTKGQFQIRLLFMLVFIMFHYYLICSTQQIALKECLQILMHQ